MTNLSVTWSLRLIGEDAMRQVGESLGRTAFPGIVLALDGNLGAGKTRLSQGVASGLGIDWRTVNSPTFSLIQEHAGRLPLFHFDTYRLRSTDEFLELGFDEYLASGGVCVIEWAGRVAEVLPPDVLFGELSHQGEDIRDCVFRARGPLSERWLRAAQSDWKTRGFDATP